MRSGHRDGSVDGGVGGDHGADQGPAWGTNHDADECADSGLGFPRPKAVPRRVVCGDSPNARPDEAADHQTDHGMLAAPGAGSGRDAHDVFALYRDVGTFLLQCEYLIGDADEISVVAFHAGFDHNNALANPQAMQVGPRALLLLSTERRREP